VPRPRLIERLNAGLHRKLTLISAPAGFGKTTLLSEWAAGCGRPVAWVSLDKGDNAPTRFWAYFVAALQTVHESVGEAALAALESPRAPPLESVLTTLINEIAAVPDHPSTSSGRSFALVLDDYHLIEAQPVHDALAFLIDHLPPQMHLILCSRADPPLPLSRLRGRDQLGELRTADLRFTPDEAAAFLNQVMGLGLSAEDVAALEARTEGWIVGLQMAALSLRGRDAERVAGFVAAFTGSHRYVLDYLTDEVLLQQPESVQTFLLRTAILDRLTGPLCDALCSVGARGVAGRGNGSAEPGLSESEGLTGSGQEMLEQLDAANLFIVPLDDERRWYRYHHLFADLLRKRLGGIQPDLIPALHRQASDWYEKSGLIAEAVSHAFAAGDVARVARLVAGNALAMLDRGELTTLVGWLDALPDEVVRRRPWLCVAHAWALVYAGRLDAAEPRLQDAEKALLKAPAWGADFDEQAEISAVSKAEGQHIAGHIAAVRAYVIWLRGDMSRAAELARGALEHLPQGDLMARGFVWSLLASARRWSGDLVAATQAYAEASAISQAAGDSHIAVNVLCDVGALQKTRGQLHEAIATWRDALKLAEEYVGRGGPRLAVIANVYALMSGVLREWNDLEAATRHARKSIELCEQGGWADVVAEGYICLAMALHAIGDGDGARNAIHKAMQVGSGFWFGLYAEALEARVWLAQGDVAAASCWAQESGLSVDDELSFQYGFVYHTLARVLIAALGLLARLLKVVEAAGAMRGVIETLVLQAMALQAQGRANEALTTLERALSLAEPEGYAYTFIGEGVPMAALLRTAASRGIALDYVGRLLAAFEEPALPSPPLIEPLSERELEVLRLLAAGLSNREIAAELFLAVGTVKKYTSNIYGKLNVHTCTQAVARARELGLV